MRRWIWTFAWLLLSIWIGGCDGGAQSSTDGNTSWLQPCGTTADCAGKLECECGFCTEACSQRSDCQNLGAHAVCAGLQSLRPACDFAPANGGLCVAECHTTADCTRGLTCQLGACAPTSRDGGEDAGKTDGSPSVAIPDADGHLPDALETADTGTDASRHTARPDSGTHPPIPIPDAGEPESGTTPEAGATLPCPDDDSDGVCNAVDRCPGFDDHADADGDGRPDGCEPVLLRDINASTGDSAPSSFAELGGQVYFVASPELYGNREIWSVDAAGGKAAQVTSLVTDVNHFELRLLTAVQNQLFFFSYNPASTTSAAVSLWVTDGATSPSLLMSKLGIDVESVAVVDGQLFFGTNDGRTTFSLWRSDGTSAGTTRIASGIGFDASTDFPIFVGCGNLVFFNGADGKLWRTDGTAGGTFAVTTAPNGLSAHTSSTRDGLLYFIAWVDAGGPQPQASIWSSDGTIAGTGPVISNPPADFSPTSVVASETYLFVGAFTDYYTFWRVRRDGTELTQVTPTGPTTVPVGSGAYLFGSGGIWWNDAAGNTTLAYQTANGEYFSNVMPAKNGAYFLKRTPDGNTLSLSHIDANGVTDLMSGATLTLFDSSAGARQNATVSSDRLFFAGQTPELGAEPWVSDGTAAGTHVLDDLNTNTLDSNAGMFASAPTPGSPVVFSATTVTAGFEPWITYGTPSTTVMLKDTAPGPANGFISPWVARDGYDFFIAENTSGKPAVHRVDSKGNLVVLANDDLDGVAPGPAYWNADRLLFHGHNDQLSVPWGDLTSPNPSVSAASLVPPVDVQDAVNWNGGVWCPTAGGVGLLRPDGTTSTTASNIDVGYAPLVPLGNTLLFVGETGTELEIHGVDATGISIGSVTDFATAGLDAPSLLQTPFKGYVYFVARDANLTYRLYRTNGTGFEQFADISLPEVFDQAAIATPVVLGNFMLMIDDAFHLWVTDGTIQGTRVLASVGQSQELVQYRGLAYFAGVDNAHGDELWRTDGTTAGTFMEADIVPGAGSSGPIGFYAAADALYFNATVPQLGNEPWVLRH